jgi:hypothetical protein
MLWSAAASVVSMTCVATVRTQSATIGREVAVVHHLKDGEEFKLPLLELIEFGRKLFCANWTEQDGGGRPLSTGDGKALSDRAQPLTGVRGFNRVSGPDANSCQGCHNAPHGIAGGSGDFVTNGFELAQRFDFVTFDRRDARAGNGAAGETARPVSLATVGNSRSTPGLFGAGYLEMLARQITRDLQRARDAIQPGGSKPLVSQGISFGILTRRHDGTWDTRAVEGLPSQSLLTSTSIVKPSLIVRPWHQSGSVVSLRELTNTSYNQHLGIQTTERFGVGTDPDGDGVVNEMTRAEVTAVTMFQATLAVPGRVIPNDPEVERAVASGEQVFDRIRCTACHVPALRLNRAGWMYAEPNPYNPSGNVRRGHVRILEVDLTNAALPQPRLTPLPDDPSVISIPAYTDFKLHDITDPADAFANEPLDMNQPVRSPSFTAGNRKFLTRRLWGVANQPPYFHHGLFTTMRQAVLAHAGEALEQRTAFERLARYEQDALIEFLKSLQVLPPGSHALIVDERYQPRAWPPGRAAEPTTRPGPK